MKFSLFYELQLSQPTLVSEQQLFHDAVAQVELADRLGYHCAWAVEHHGLYEYSHCSAPEVFLSFVAARTKEIRLGHGVNLLPFRYNHPIRVAERLATLDILSGGRLSWGTGKSASAVEQAAFEVNPSRVDLEWEEALRMVLKIWQSDVFEYESPSFSIPPTRIVPRPMQLPHPPVFAACTSTQSLKRAGDLRLGALNFSFGSTAQIASNLAAYRGAVAQGAPVGAFGVNHFACAPAALVLENDREACRHGFRAARFFGDAMSHYYANPGPPSPSLAARRDFLADDKLEEAMRLRNGEGDEFNVLCGDPSFAREYVSRFVELGVDELILVMQMGTVPAEMVLQSVRIFGEKVLPHFA